MALGDELPELLTVKEVATFLRVSPLTIKRWGKRGKLPAIRINARGDRRYKKEAVLWLLGEMKKEVAQLFEPSSTSTLCFPDSNTGSVCPSIIFPFTLICFTPALTPFGLLT